ncbi:hypothetical protein [Deinococcus sedimenti]|uniref:DUF11 domain-containing protein n=1 Tax=Deinococcus sedimenti TaxID=1867090 RepID=A0ABQ2S909_9DEIO|nr:hypothetical protein [Deinococcus sedimenti]GGS01897.1 DUF11 domain-containing protein [Deinococcus sedimenti]
MKKTHLFTLMAALAVGSATAQTASVSRTGNLTNAGLTITNTATASFQDPSNTASTMTSSSNTVSTTVLPKYGFNITYPAGGDSDTTDLVTGAPATHQRTNVVPGTSVAFAYVAVNNGNAAQTITLTNNATTGVSNVRYYLSNPDTNGDGIITASDTATPIAADGSGNINLTLPVQGDDPGTPAVETSTGMVTFYMAYAATGVGDAVVGATPIGTGQVWSGTANVSAIEQKDPGTPSYDDLWWQYSSAKIVKAQLTNDPQNPGTGTVTPPPTGSTTTPGYTSPTGPTGSTPIAVSGDEQIAYPKADADALNDSVTFTNTVKNGAAIADTVALSVVPRTTFPATGYSQVVATTGTAGVYTVTQTNPDGSTTVATVTLSTTSLTVAATGSSTYDVTVSYPDQDSGTPYPVYVAVGAESGNDTDTTVDDTTYDTIYPPAMQFKDQVTDLNTQAGTAGNTVSFPMTVVNPGEYADTYTLSGYTVVTLLDGSKQLVGIVYSSATAGDVTLTGTRSVTDAASGQTATINVYTTRSVSANGSLNVSAGVALPGGTNPVAYTTSTTAYTVNQTATAVYSGITASDTNDKITVALNGALAVAKFTQTATTYAANSEYVLGTTATSGTSTDAKAIANPADYSAMNTLGRTSYAPGVNYSYRIIAKNTYNTRVERFFLSDSLNANLTLVSVTGSVSGNTIVGSTDTSGATIIYSTDNVTWTTTAPTTGSALYVAVDDPAQTGNQPGSLDPSATLEMTITVNIK